MTSATSGTRSPRGIRGYHASHGPNLHQASCWGSGRSGTRRPASARASARTTFIRGANIRVTAVCMVAIRAPAACLGSSSCCTMHIRCDPDVRSRMKVVRAEARAEAGLLGPDRQAPAARSAEMLMRGVIADLAGTSSRMLRRLCVRGRGCAAGPARARGSQRRRHRARAPGRARADCEFVAWAAAAVSWGRAARM